MFTDITLLDSQSTATIASLRYYRNILADVIRYLDQQDCLSYLFMNGRG